MKCMSRVRWNPYRNPEGFQYEMIEDPQCRSAFSCLNVSFPQGQEERTSILVSSAPIKIRFYVELNESKFVN